MNKLRKLNRRSFVAVVAGGACGCGALALVIGDVEAQTGSLGLSDHDRGAGADPAGRGRGPPPAANGKVRSGLTDSDVADPVGNGLGSRRPHGACADGDPHDPRGGAARPCGAARKPSAGSGVTDQDPGDPALNGRDAMRCDRERRAIRELEAQLRAARSRRHEAAIRAELVAARRRLAALPCR